jgi:hypothetical protein
MGNAPCLLGEFGLPFDLNRRRAYRTGDYRLHEAALDRYYDGVDANLLHSTIWNYTSDNTHDEGDGWNGEDLSIVHNGVGRASGGWLRPYPMATAGEPLFFSWDRGGRVFRFRFRADPSIQEPTEVFVPADCFGGAVDVRANPTLRVQYQRLHQRVCVYNESYNGEVEISVRPGGSAYSQGRKQAESEAGSY